MASNNQPVNIHAKGPDGRWTWVGTFASATFEVNDRGELQLWVTPGRRPLMRAIIERDGETGRAEVRGWHSPTGHPNPTTPQAFEIEVTTADLSKA